MSQDRILGSAVVLQVYGPNGPVPLAEIDKFTAKNAEELKKHHPLGQVQPRGQIVYGGYDLSFQGAKVNDDWEQIAKANDINLLSGKAAPRYRVVEQKTWYSGKVENWVYDDVLLFGFNAEAAMSNEEIKHDFSGYAPSRTDGSFAPNLGVISAI
jgi:hypothetical protein